MAAMISSAEKSPGIEALETLGVNNRLDLLNKSLHLGNVRLHILLSPVQKIIIIPRYDAYSGAWPAGCRPHWQGFLYGHSADQSYR